LAKGVAGDIPVVLVLAVKDHSGQRHVLPTQVAVGAEEALRDRGQPHVLIAQGGHRRSRLRGHLLPKSHTGKGDCENDGTFHGTSG
jgi:hypothetical protein